MMDHDAAVCPLHPLLLSCQALHSFVFLLGYTSYGPMFFTIYFAVFYLFLSYFPSHCPCCPFSAPSQGQRRKAAKKKLAPLPAIGGDILNHLPFC